MITRSSPFTTAIEPGPTRESSSAVKAQEHRPMMNPVDAPSQQPHSGARVEAANAASGTSISMPAVVGSGDPLNETMTIEVPAHALDYVKHLLLIGECYAGAQAEAAIGTVVRQLNVHLRRIAADEAAVAAEHALSPREKLTASSETASETPVVPPVSWEGSVARMPTLPDAVEVGEPLPLPFAERSSSVTPSQTPDAQQPVAPRLWGGAGGLNPAFG